MIFEKILNWFKKILGKDNNQLLIEDGNIEIELEPALNDNFDDFILNKNEFFELYSNIKEQNIEIENVDIEELIEFNMIAEKEIEIKNKKLEEQIQENIKLKQEIENLNQEELNLKKRVKAFSN